MERLNLGDIVRYGEGKFALMRVDAIHGGTIVVGVDPFGGAVRERIGLVKRAKDYEIEACKKHRYFKGWDRQ